MKIVLSILLWAVSAFSFGQLLEAKIDADHVLIGEPVIVTYTAKTDEGSSIVFTPLTESLQSRTSEGGVLSNDGIEFELFDEFQDTTYTENGTLEWVGTYTIVAWDSGAYIIPGPTIVINDSTLRFKDLSIRTSLVDQKEDIELYDIVEVEPDQLSASYYIKAFFKKHWWWMALIVVAIIAFLLFRRAKKHKQPIEIFKPMSLKERTLLAIEALEKEKMWEQGKLKEHFVELSFLLRSYLTSRYDLSLLEKTTYETKILLTQEGLNDDTVETIIRILSESDMVKFAKSEPDTIAILRVSTLAKQIVAETSPLEFDNVE